MHVGYPRVSTQDQEPALELDALGNAGCRKVATEKALGAQRDRAKLEAAQLHSCRGGRPSAVSADYLTAAKALLHGPKVIVEEKVTRLDAARSTPCPTVPEGCGAKAMARPVQEEEP
jgi:hypothetical protein